MVTKAKSHNLTAVQVDGHGLAALMQGRTGQPERSPKGVFRSMIRRYRARYGSALALLWVALYIAPGDNQLSVFLAGLIGIAVLTLWHARRTHSALAKAVSQGRLEWLRPRRWKRRAVSGDVNGVRTGAKAAPFSLAMTDSEGRVAVLKKGRTAWVLGAEMLRERFGLDYQRVKRLFGDPDQRFAVARLYGPEALVHLITDEQETTRNRQGGVQFLKSPPSEWKGWYKPAATRKKLRDVLEDIDDPAVMGDVLRWISWKPAAPPAPLGKAIRIGDSDLIHIARHLLERSKHPDAEATALALLDENRLEVRIAAVRVLGSIGSGAALDRLAELRKTAEPELIGPIASSIEQLSGRVRNSTYEGRLAIAEESLDEGHLSMADTEGGLAFPEEIDSSQDVGVEASDEVVEVAAEVAETTD